MTNFLAIDLGASSRRVILGLWDAQRFDLQEVHRFPNGPVHVMGHLHWDVLRLWQGTQTGIAHYAAEHDEPLAGIGIDTWAVDFALLDGAGRRAVEASVHLATFMPRASGDWDSAYARFEALLG